MADGDGAVGGRRRVLLIAPPTSYRISAYCQAARRLGVDLVVASRGEYSLVPEIAAGINIDLESPSRVVDTVLDENKRRPFHAVIATDDATVELASHVAGALGLPHNPVAATRTARRKDLARRSLAAAGLPVPAFRRIDLSIALTAQVLDLSYPCVVKPLALSASRGVIRVDNFDELDAACRRIAPRPDSRLRHIPRELQPHRLRLSGAQRHRHGKRNILLPRLPGSNHPVFIFRLEP